MKNQPKQIQRKSGGGFAMVSLLASSSPDVVSCFEEILLSCRLQRKLFKAHKLSRLKDSSPLSFFPYVFQIKNKQTDKQKQKEKATIIVKHSLENQFGPATWKIENLGEKKTSLRKNRHIKKHYFHIHRNKKRKGLSFRFCLCQNVIVQRINL